MPLWFVTMPRAAVCYGKRAGGGSYRREAFIVDNTIIIVDNIRVCAAGDDGGADGDGGGGAAAAHLKRGNKTGAIRRKTIPGGRGRAASKRQQAMGLLLKQAD